MSDYTATGNPLQSSSGKSKIIRDEFTLIETAINSKANIASPALTGLPTAPTATAGTSTTQIATTAFVSATAFASSLPAQPGKVNYILTTNGTDASWTNDFSFDGVFNEKHGTDVASAGTIDLDAATGNLIDVTGTTTITAITLADGAERTVRFTSALTLTNGASLVLPGGANITTAAGDFAVFRGYASSIVRCVNYVRASGKAVTPSPQGMVLLSSVTAAASSTVDLEATFDATYDVYIISGSGIVMSNDGAGILSRFKMGGSYDTSTNYRFHISSMTSGAATYAGGNHNTQTYMQVNGDIGNGAGKTSSFMMRVYHPSSTSLMKVADWYGTHIGSSGNGIITSRGSGANVSTTALTGVRFYPSVGTIISGKFRLYGVKI